MALAVPAAAAYGWAVAVTVGELAVFLAGAVIVAVAVTVTGTVFIVVVGRRRNAKYRNQESGR